MRQSLSVVTGSSFSIVGALSLIMIKAAGRFRKSKNKSACRTLRSPQMPDFEKMTPELSRLFLRLDAAAPADPVLQAVAALWQERRGSALYPTQRLIDELPTFARPHTLLDLTAEKGEPYAVSFELEPPGGAIRFCEAYAAPLASAHGGAPAILAVLNWRAEAKQ
jgi:hypothetical protein